jgi:hypothetical protein
MLPAFREYYLSCPVYRLPRKPGSVDKDIPPPGEFPAFHFLAKEDPDIDVSPYFLSGEQARYGNVHLYVTVRSNSVSPL